MNFSRGRRSLILRNYFKAPEIQASASRGLLLEMVRGREGPEKAREWKRGRVLCRLNTNPKVIWVKVHFLLLYKTGTIYWGYCFWCVQNKYCFLDLNTYQKVLQPYLYPLSITSTALMDTEALCGFTDSPLSALALKSQLHSSSSLSVGRYPHTTFRSPSPFELT